jgi:hypothetical protein
VENANIQAKGKKPPNQTLQYYDAKVMLAAAYGAAGQI